MLLYTRWEVGMPDEQQVQITCIACPLGCNAELTVRNGEIVKVAGAQCKRGEGYVKQEYTDPRRILTTTVRIEGDGWLPVISSAMVPKPMIYDIMQQIRKATCKPPVEVGQVVLSNVLGTGVDIVASAPCLNNITPNPGK
jgi:CxxC motif-containing protein